MQMRTLFSGDSVARTINHEISSGKRGEQKTHTHTHIYTERREKEKEEREKERDLADHALHERVKRD